MEHSAPKKIAGLPDNARRPLKADESYVPVVSSVEGEGTTVTVRLPAARTRKAA